jgi:septum site-determining protein MinC
MDSTVQIKGIREGLLVTLSDGDWPTVFSAFLSHIDKQVNFLKGGKIYIDVGNQVLHVVELSKLKDAVSERSLTLWGVLSNSPTTEQTAQLLGLATRLSRPSRQTRYRESIDADIDYKESESALMVRRTLRSGYSLKHPGHIVIIGDINLGAEVIASGSVVIWGKLRGVVHAGAEGDTNANVYALDLSPTQLWIAGQNATLPLKRIKQQPESARLRDGEVVVETWNPGKKIE